MANFCKNCGKKLSTSQKRSTDALCNTCSDALASAHNAKAAKAEQIENIGDTDRVFYYWAQHSGIRENVEGLGKDRIAAARRDVNKLLSAQSEDEARTVLKETSPRDNASSAWSILGAVVNAGIDNADERMLALINLELLIAGYADEDQLLRAHGTLLKGLLFHLAGRHTEAKEAYEASINAYGTLAGCQNSLSVCLFCFGKLKANMADIDEANVNFVSALKMVDLNTPAGTAWSNIVLKQQAKLGKQYELTSRLIECQTPQSQRLLLEQNETLSDGDLLAILESRTRQLVFQARYKQADDLAALIDFAHTSRGEKAAFRKELAGYYLNSNLFEHAETIFRQILENTPHDEDAEFGLAVSLFQQNKLEESKRVLDIILEANPKNAGAHCCIGDVYLKQREFDLARKHFNICLGLNPEDAFARRMLELTLATMAAANHDQANEFLKAIANEEGEDVAEKVAALLASPTKSQLTHQGRLHYSKAEDLFGSKRLAEAIGEYKQVIEQNPQFAPAYMGLGDCYYMMGKFREAAAFFEQSVAIYPDAPTYRYLGDAYMRLGDRDQAIKAYQAAVKTDPNYEVAQIALRIALEQK